MGQLKAEHLHGISAAASTTTVIPITASTVIEVILSTILQHGRYIRIVEESVRTLRRLTFKPSKCENTANVSIDKRHLEKSTCARIERRGGIRLAVNILKDYPNCRKIQFDCLRIVRNILSCLEVSESTATSYIDHDALKAIIQTMLKHGEWKAVQEDGCALLWMLIQYHLVSNKDCRPDGNSGYSRGNGYAESCRTSSLSRMRGATCAFMQ